MDAYIYDMVIKSKKKPDHPKDLAEVFVIIKEHKLRLNAANCAFGVNSGKFLGHLVTQRGIKANPWKISTIDDLVSPRTTKEVQN